MWGHEESYLIGFNLVRVFKRKQLHNQLGGTRKQVCKPQAVRAEYLPYLNETRILFITIQSYL